jgi:hypothetical protein
MLDRIVTPGISSLVVAFLRKHRWSNARIAKVIDAPREFVDMVEKKVQKFTESDLRKLSRSLKTRPHRLLIDAIDASVLPADIRRMIDMGRPLMVAPSVFPERKTARSKPVARARLKAA